MDRDRYAAYRKWCTQRRKPVLLVPSGLQQIGNQRFKDGLTYEGRKKKPTGFYIPLVRYGGTEMAVKWSLRSDIHRFERVRWALLNFMETVVDPRVREHEERMANHEQPITGRRGKKPVVLTATRETSADSDATYINIEEARRKADGEDEDLLTGMAWEAVGDDSEQGLVDRHYRLKQWREDYWWKLGRVNGAIESLLQTLRSTDRYHLRQQPMPVTINGRRYVSGGGMRVGHQEADFWPSPRQRSVNLDTPEGLAELDAVCSRPYVY